MNPTVLQVLQARIEDARAFTSKFEALLHRAGPDGAVRDWAAYHAAHTGRWSSRGVQLHNMIRPPENVDIDAVLDAALAGDGERLRQLVPADLRFSDVLSVLLRPCFKARPGHVLLLADYNAIEPRCVGWMADEDRLLDPYRADRDVYCEFASKYLFNREIIKGRKEDKQPRQVAKSAVIGCLSYGTPVLTSMGWFPIQSVPASAKVWDGVDWVEHDGVVAKGVKRCVKVGGVWLTPDHLVLTERGWREAGEIRTEPQLPAGVTVAGESKTSNAGREEESSESWGDAIAGLLPVFLKEIYAAVVLLAAACARGGRLLKREWRKPATQRLFPTPNCEHLFSTELASSSIAARTQSPDRIGTTVPEGFGFTRHGSRIGENFYSILRHWLGGVSPVWKSTASTIPGATSRRIFGLRRAVTNAKTLANVGTSNGRGRGGARQNFGGASVRGTDVPRSCCERFETASIPQQLSPSNLDAEERIVETFDLLNAGPRNRFQAGGLIVHNCGYQLGHERFALYAAANGADLEAAGVTPQQVVEAYRDAYPKIAGVRKGGRNGIVFRKGGLWQAVKLAMMTCIETGRPQYAGKCEFVMRDNAMVIVLPSGRPLYYPNARIELRIPGYAANLPNPQPRPSVVYGKDEMTYSGRAVENMDQAMCRDLLATSMVTCEAEGLPVVLHAHDEIVCEVPEARAEEALHTLCDIMVERPDWAKGWPIKVEGYTSPRYTKNPLKGALKHEASVL